ncbi:hypothetical protein MTR_7g006620 [Medicago truncatula]|uniref:Uncharacterized protein n=1 Tax=Medicago truncatula TaxID=3880 RepID=G7KXR7_MEDTR|nr:hypothetical protein MTR_7g006620 [Medicago truncatula]
MVPINKKKTNTTCFTPLYVSIIVLKVFVRFRLSDQLQSSADPINDFGVVNIEDPET